VISIAFSSSFKKVFAKSIKNNPDLEELFWEKVKLFIENPFDKRLRTHKLSGKLKDLWSFSVRYDIRVVFYFEDRRKCVFVDIGTHNEVY
jgi:addiction module RelE/StbE family toxin